MGDRPSRHPLPAPLSAFKALSPFQVPENQRPCRPPRFLVKSPWLSCTALLSHLHHLLHDSLAPDFRIPNTRENTLKATFTVCPATNPPSQVIRSQILSIFFNVGRKIHKNKILIKCPIIQAYRPLSADLHKGGFFHLIKSMDDVKIIQEMQRMA